VEALNNLLVSDAKKHLAYTNELSGGQQMADKLAKQASAHKTKFKTGQKSQLDDLIRKRKAEEDKQ
jgi:hypothetical protein